MTDENATPTGPERTVNVHVPPEHREFVCRVLDACASGVYGDLATASADLRDPERAWREADAYSRLLAGIDSGSIVPDAEVRRVLRELAEQNDVANEYERVLREHRALWRLLVSLDPAAAER